MAFGLVGQAVKTPASHAGNAGSIPARVTIIFWFFFSFLHMLILVGVDDAGGTPVPFPNTEVKPSGAENTWLVTVREDKKTPTFYIPP